MVVNGAAAAELENSKGLQYITAMKHGISVPRSLLTARPTPEVFFFVGERERVREKGERETEREKKKKRCMYLLHACVSVCEYLCVSVCVCALCLSVMHSRALATHKHNYFFYYFQRLTVFFTHFYVCRY